MKTGDFTPRPGDIFRWHFDYNDSLARKNDESWSSSMEKIIPVWSENLLLLVSITDEIISWLDGVTYTHIKVGDAVWYHPRCVQ